MGRQVATQRGGAIRQARYDRESEQDEEGQEKGKGRRRTCVDIVCFQILVLLWAVAFLTAMFSASSIRGKLDTHKNASLPQILSEKRTGMKGEGTTGIPQVNGSEIVKELSKDELLALRVVLRRPDSEGPTSWRDIDPNLGKAQSQELRKKLFARALASVNLAIDQQGVEVWDDASCIDVHPKECPGWACREPSECSKLDSFSFTCRRSCGYCGALGLVAEELGIGSEQHPLKVQTAVAKIPLYLRADGARSSDSEKKKLERVGERSSSQVEDFLRGAKSRRARVHPEEADKFISKAAQVHAALYPPPTHVGSDPAIVAEHGQTFLPVRTCDDVKRKGEHQTKALEQLSVRVLGPGRGEKGAKLLCVLEAAGQSKQSIRMSLHTWGHNCDGFLAFSDEEDAELGSVKLKLAEGLDGKWQRTRAALFHVWRHHISAGGKYDAIILVRGLAFVVPQNLRSILAGEEEKLLPRYIGRVVSKSGRINDILTLGGAGVCTFECDQRVRVVKK